MKKDLQDKQVRIALNNSIIGLDLPQAAVE